jgi:hypothetical protein
MSAFGPEADILMNPHVEVREGASSLIHLPVSAGHVKKPDLLCI